MENLLGLKKILSPFFLVLGLALVGLCACGSGSTSTPPPPQPISYTGLTTQATVRDNNAHDLATGSYQGGTLVSAGGLQPMQERAAERSRYLNLAFSVEEAINKIDVQATPAIPSSSTVTKSIESSSITGSCGGSGQYTIDYNANTEDFSGTINFNSYCSQGVTLTGTASFSGKFDVNTQRFLEYSLSFDRITGITVNTGGNSFTIAGTISYNFQASPINASMEMLLRDNATGKVYWVNNYNLKMWLTATYVEFQVSGRYYAPDQGFVNVSTTTNFRIYSGANWPNQGVLVVEGKTAIGGGSTGALLTVISWSTYQVEADTNGDGTYDWNSGVQSWS